MKTKTFPENTLTFYFNSTTSSAYRFLLYYNLPGYFFDLLGQNINYRIQEDMPKSNQSTKLNGDEKHKPAK